MNKEINNVMLENAQIMFRNFAGKPDKFNPLGGRRSFSVRLNPELAADLEVEGWNIKTLKPREGEEDEPLKPFLTVRVNYGTIPPNIYLISGNKKSLLDEDSVDALDFAEITKVDLIVRPYQWDVNGKQGITAYVKNMYVTIARDDFASKYDDLGNEE